ncbi:MAG: PEGA domain-containing protein [Symbiobacteriia bacterium]
MFRLRSARRHGAVLIVLLLAASLLSACRGPAETATQPLPELGTAPELGHGPAQPSSAPSFPPGSFVIRSNPSGANVYVDGRLIGRTPVAYPKDGDSQHVLYLTLDGYSVSNPWFTDFNGDGITVDLAFVGPKGSREALEAPPLMPEVAPVDNPAGNRAWRITGVSLYGTTISPDGRYLVARADAVDGQSARVDTFAVDLQSGEARQVARYLRGGVAPIGDPESVVGWLSDADAVLLTRREPQDDPMNPALSVLKVNVVSGKQEFLGDLGRWAEGSINVKKSWLTGDHKAVFAHVSGHVWGLDLATKQRVLNVPVPTWDGLFQLSPSPDGWSVAYAGYDQEEGNAPVCWLNLRTGEEKLVSPSDMYAQGAWWSADGQRLAYGVSPRHANGYPVLQWEDGALLLPDAMEIVDLPALTRQRIALPGGPVTFARGDDFESTVVIHVDVTGDTSQPGVWQLQTRGLSRLSLTAGKVSGESLLSLPAGTYVEDSRADGEGGYLATLKPIDGSPHDPQDSKGDRTIHVYADGRTESLPGYALLTFSGPVAGEDWPLLYVNEGLSWADGRRLLTGPAATGDYFLALAAQGWVVLAGRGQEEEMVVVANPPATA